MKTIKRIILITLFVICNNVANSQVTVYNNFGIENNGFDYKHNLGWSIAGNNVNQYGVEQAIAFQSTVDGILSDIWLAVSCAPNALEPDTINIKIAQHFHGMSPDSLYIIEEWNITDIKSWSQWNEPHHLKGNGLTELNKNEWYWLWLTPSDTTVCMWALNIDHRVVCPHTLRREYEDWLNTSNETSGAFRVDCMPIMSIETYKNTKPEYLLNQNYPNPFNKTTKLSYSISESDVVKLIVYDVIGREVKELVNEFQEKNTYCVDFDAHGLSSGIYYYKLQVGSNVIETKKMLYLR